MMGANSPNAAKARMAMHQIRELRRLLRYVDARRVALNVIDLWHLSTPLIRALPNLNWPEEQRKRVAQRLVEIGRNSTGQMREECVVGLIVTGSEADASELLEELASQPGHSDSIVLRGIIDSFRSPTTRPTPSFADNIVTSAVKQGAKRCLLVFHGAMDGLGIPLPLFDHLIAPLDATVLYFRDKHRTLYLTGIDGVGTDFATTVEGIRKMVADAGATDIYTLGNSSGGIGALRYGLALGARGIMGMATPTNLQVDFMAKDGRFVDIYSKLNEMFPRDELDMTRYIAEGSPSQRILLYFGDGHKMDRMHAENAKGLPGVEMRPVANFDAHSVLRPIMERGELLPAISELLELPTP